MMRCWAMEESFLRLMTGVVQEIRPGKQQVYIVLFFFLFFLPVGRDGKRPESGQFLLFCSFFFCFCGSRVLVLSGETAETTQSLVYSWERVGADLLHHHWADDGRDKRERNCWPCLFLSRVVYMARLEMRELSLTPKKKLIQVNLSLAQSSGNNR
jgi:hypothetical protein